MEDFISFIIPSFNNERTIGECIESILKQHCQKEVIVVDGGSTDKTMGIIRNYNTTLLMEKKRGAAAARNRGSRVAKGNYVAFVDADAVLSDNWIERALKTIKGADRNVAGIAGPVFSMEKKAIGRALDSLSFGMPGKGTLYYTNGLNTTGVLFKMDIFRKFRFDETFIRGEDTEMGFRIGRKGYKFLFDKELIVYHHHPTSIKELVKKWFVFGKSYPLSYLKHKTMRGMGFYAKLLYLPLLCLLISLSFLWGFVFWLVCLQLLALFLLYIFIGMQIPQKTRKVDILTFTVIHWIKQLSKLTGIWYGFLERAS